MEERFLIWIGAYGELKSSLIFDFYWNSLTRLNNNISKYVVPDYFAALPDDIRAAINP